MRFRRGSIVIIKSGYVVVVEAVSLHHRQSDNFCKIEKGNAKGTSAITYM
jgi:hypothetical protein